MPSPSTSSTLRRALELILNHKKEIDEEFYNSIHYKLLVGNKHQIEEKEILRRWFIIAIGPGWRGGPAPSYCKRVRMLKEFDLWYNRVVNEILPSYSGQKAVDMIIKALTNISGIGPKIAGVYLKDIVYHFGIWGHLRNYLYLPIDRHVRNIMVKRLRVFDKREVPNVGESYFTKKNQRFQRLLDSIHRPRVEFDYFWVIGARFCAFYLCDLCWIRELCKDKRSLL